MTVPFDPKPSDDLYALLRSDDTANAVLRAAHLGVDIEFASQDVASGGAVHHSVTRRAAKLAGALRTAVAALDAAAAIRSVGRMVDGDLWHREPAVMTAADLGLDPHPGDPQ